MRPEDITATGSFRCTRCTRRVPGAVLFLSAANDPVCGDCYVADPPESDVSGVLADLEAL